MEFDAGFIKHSNKNQFINFILPQSDRLKTSPQKKNPALTRKIKGQKLHLQKIMLNELVNTWLKSYDSNESVSNL